MVKYLSFRASSFALRCFLRCKMARPQCDTPLVWIQINSLLLPSRWEICHHREVGGSALISTPHVLLRVAAGCERLGCTQKMGWNVQNGDGAIFALQSVMIPTCRFCPHYMQQLVQIMVSEFMPLSGWVMRGKTVPCWSSFLAADLVNAFFFPLSPSIWHCHSPFWN
jgi:hypothetical protein